MENAHMYKQITHTQIHVQTHTQTHIYPNTHRHTHTQKHTHFSFFSTLILQWRLFVDSKLGNLLENEIPMQPCYASVLLILALKNNKSIIIGSISILLPVVSSREY
jgi:hypothetical protein